MDRRNEYRKSKAQILIYMDKETKEKIKEKAKKQNKTTVKYIVDLIEKDIQKA